jgi:ElaB/YqjD/DUF883 family membrane-anchored ribosome-binding protein
MNAEELTQEKDKPLQFDAHEFDGLREVLEQEAESILARLDQYVRQNPWLAIGVAAAAGFLVAYAVRGNSAPRSAGASEPARNGTAAPG